MRLAWLLRSRDWRTFHVHRCLECRRKFSDEEPGSWADYRYDEFPGLCSPYSCKSMRHGGRSHGGSCRSGGPFCPACAAQVEEFWTRQREAYRD